MKRITTVAITTFFMISLNAQNSSPIFFSDKVNNEHIHFGEEVQKEIISKENLSAGDHLQLASRRMYIGMALSSGGSLIMLGSSFISENDPTKQITLISGGIMSLVGMIVSIESISHIGKAGMILNEYGVGVKIPIK